MTGVNWNVKLMALKAASANGSLTEAWIVQAFQYACANGARVINGSFGGPDFPQAILDAINACPGALFVFAAGNDGTNNDFIPAYPCNLAPANVVCVAATDLGRRTGDFLELRSQHRRPRRAGRRHSQHDPGEQLRRLQRHVDGDAARRRRRRADPVVEPVRLSRCGCARRSSPASM